MGTTGGEVIEIGASDGSSIHPEGVILHTHSLGEACSLASHPELSEFVTVGDDATLRVWDALDRRQSRMLVLPTASRCVAFHPSGEFVVIGLGSPQGTERASRIRPADAASDPAAAEAARREGAFMVLRYRCVNLQRLLTVDEAHDARTAAVILRLSMLLATRANGSHVCATLRMAAL